MVEFLYRQPVEIHFGAGKAQKLREVMGLTEEDIYNRMKELASK